MIALQVSVAFLLLRVNFDPVAAYRFVVNTECPPCPQGTFVKQNCSVSGEIWIGVKCAVCTKCSASDQDTVSECSKFADSVCRDRSPAMVVSSSVPPEPTTAPAPVKRIHYTVVVLALFGVLLLGSGLFLLSCKRRSHENLGGSESTFTV